MKGRVGTLHCGTSLHMHFKSCLEAYSLESFYFVLQEAWGSLFYYSVVKFSDSCFLDFPVTSLVVSLVLPVRSTTERAIEAYITVNRTPLPLEFWGNRNWLKMKQFRFLTMRNIYSYISDSTSRPIEEVEGFETNGKIFAWFRRVLSMRWLSKNVREAAVRTWQVWLCTANVCLEYWEKTYAIFLDEKWLWGRGKLGIIWLIYFGRAEKKT